MLGSGGHFINPANEPALQCQPSPEPAQLDCFRVYWM